MLGYRVSKYDPEQREANGAFLLEDWTSASDIGRSIGGKTMTKQQYLAVEDKYVEAATQLLETAGIGALRISDLEVKTEGSDKRFEDDGLAKQCLQLRDDLLVAGRDLETVVRGCLREYIWCRLAGPKESYLHFGYDYYMYIGLPKVPSAAAVPQGLFLERLESPYLTLDD